MGVLGRVFVLKSGLRILIRAPEVSFSVPPKTGVFGLFSAQVSLSPIVCNATLQEFVGLYSVNLHQRVYIVFTMTPHVT